MKHPTPKRKRPAVLVRFYPDDLTTLNRHCADTCQPRENFIRRCVLAALTPAAKTRKAGPK